MAGFRSMDSYAALEGQKRESPAAERNKQPILEVLLEFLPPADKAGSAAGSPPLVLEVASGSGQHAAHFAPALASLGYELQPSDCTQELFGSIAGYCHPLPNVRLPPLLLDMSSALAEAGAPGPAPWPLAALQAGGGRPLAALLCINMAHISPVEATLGLLRGAGQSLQPGSGLLFLYGPFAVDGAMTEGNAAFDASLRARDPSWGLRDVRDVVAWAEAEGLQHLGSRAMPANNLTLVFRRRG